MLGFISRGFAWRSSLGKGRRKLRFNEQLGVTKPENRTDVPKHDYILFQNLSGNEILYSLKDVEHFRPGELWNALNQLSLRKGAPEEYDWNINPYVSNTVTHCKAWIPRWNPETLSRVCHSAARLDIKDEEFWTLMEKYIERINYKLEPKGIANVIYAFGQAGHGSEKFFNDLEALCPRAIRVLKPRELHNMITGFVMAGQGSENIFQKWIYPYLTKQLRRCSPTMLDRIRASLEQRSDFTEELSQEISEARAYKVEQKRILDLSGNFVLEAFDGSEKHS